MQIVRTMGGKQYLSPIPGRSLPFATCDALARPNQDVRTPVLAAIGEIRRPESTTSVGTTPIRGGLSARKQKLVVEYIEQHLAEEISLAALARLAALSSYHFARAFRHSFGVPPHRYHMVRRMKQAQDLLLRSTLPVTQISIRIGFRETSSFTKAYRRYAGVTPSEFRRQRVDYSLFERSGCRFA
jgi:AraC family transcriptional regulator